MPHLKKIFFTFLLCLTTLLLSLSVQSQPVKASSPFAFVILTKYTATVDIGDEFYVIALTSNVKNPTWKSSNSKVASVNTYGKITAKKKGTAVITAKIKGAEASCKVTVNKTILSISKTSASIEHDETLALSATTSNGSKVTWKSSKKSVATIDERGMVTGMKPGTTTITATADGSKATCKVTVKSPSIKLSDTRITLCRGWTYQITAKVSSGITPIWKSNKKSIAIIDGSGVITAIKHGTATITATVDGVDKSCTVTVDQPTITLSQTELNMKKGYTVILNAEVSSGNLPTWSTSNPNVASVDKSGCITAIKKGRAYIYASEDGVKMRCTIYVT
ncbi:MAG TPA: Ig-like domain-containing protein [Mobilitalea sp.]|nr:Ig-like domain-containing protein [Mobilitalea sp.]